MCAEFIHSMIFNVARKTLCIEIVNPIYSPQCVYSFYVGYIHLWINILTAAKFVKCQVWSNTKCWGKISVSCSISAVVWLLGQKTSYSRLVFVLFVRSSTRILHDATITLMCWDKHVSSCIWWFTWTFNCLFDIHMNTFVHTLSNPKPANTRFWIVI